MSGLLAAAMLAVSVPGRAGAVWAAESGLEDSFIKQFEEGTYNSGTRIRWWVPGGNMKEEEIAKELTAIAEAGFGGIEVVPMSLTGEQGDYIDWGTEQWNHMMKFALEKAGELGLTVDFTMTPAWPLALPNIQDVDDPASGAQQEMDGAWVDGITKDNPYNAKAPASEEAVKDAEKVAGTPVLAAVTVAKYSDKEGKVLDYDSARSLPVGQGADEVISFTPEDDGEYVLFAWWQHPSGEKKYGNNQVDHYGKAGSQAIMDYWEEVLIPYYGDAFAQVESLFVDSLEFETHLDWTWGVLEDFQKRYQYELSPYLPAVYQAACGGNYASSPREGDFRFDEKNTQVLNDYKDEITQLYIENHLMPLAEWCQSMGKNLRYQTAYGKTLELGQTAMYVDIPETESLFGNDKLDFYRLQSGAVHMADKKVYSIESAPELGGDWLSRGNGEKDASNYQQTWTDLLWHLQRAYAAGVNQVVVHGYSYRGQYDGEGNVDGYVAGAVWPGYEGFSSAGFSNSWGERQPNWKNVEDITGFLNRNQMVLQQGEAKVDVAVYALRYHENIDFLQAFGLPGDVYTDGGVLENTGYSYDFVSPSALALDNAVVKDGVLDAAGPGYKALIINNETEIPQKTAERLAEYAQAGFPVVFVGKVPQGASHSAGQDTVASLMKQVTQAPKTKVVDTTAQVPGALAQLGVVPSVQYEQADLLAAHRETSSADFYYLYNDGGSANYPDTAAADTVTAEISVEGEGKPYLLDAWTGEIIPVAEYMVKDGRLRMTVTLKGNESLLLAVTTEHWGGPESHVIAKNDSRLWVSGAEDGSLLVKYSEPGVYSLMLSDGSCMTFTTEEKTAPCTMGKWSLRVDGFSKGSSPSDTVRNVYDCGELATLTAWKDIGGLGDAVAGIGTYTVRIHTEEGWDDGAGLLLDLGDVTDSYSVEVNKTKVPVSQNNTCVDIGKYLKRGDNEVTVTVASTLLNAVIAANGESDTRTPDAYGILNEVKITPYRWRKVIAQAGDVEQLIQIGALERILKVYQDMDLRSYTETSANNLRRALQEAEAVMRNPAAGAEEVSRAISALTAAAASLQVDVSGSQKAVEEARQQLTKAQKELEKAQADAAKAQADAVKAREDAAKARADGVKAQENADKALAVKKGMVVTKGKLTYKITSQSEAELIGTAQADRKKITIPSTITVNGKTFKVTSVGAKAFKGNTNIKNVVIGKNIKKIQKEAFRGCTKLTSIEIRSTKLKSVGKNAIRGMDKKAVIKCPKKKRAGYKKLFKSSTGFTRTMRVK